MASFTPDPTPLTANALRSVVSIFDISQAFLAQATNTHHTGVSLHLSGQRPLHGHHVAAYCRAISGFSTSAAATILQAWLQDMQLSDIVEAVAASESPSSDRLCEEVLPYGEPEPLSRVSSLLSSLHPALQADLHFLGLRAKLDQDVAELIRLLAGQLGKP